LVTETKLRLAVDGLMTASELHLGPCTKNMVMFAITMLCAAVYFSGSSYSCSHIRTNLRVRAGSLRTDALLVGCITISDARPADRLCSKRHCTAAAGKHAVGEPGQVRARACANTCSTLLSRRPAGSKSHPPCRVCAPLHTRCRPLRSGGRAISLKDTDTLCVRNIRDLPQNLIILRQYGTSPPYPSTDVGHPLGPPAVKAPRRVPQPTVDT